MKKYLLLLAIAGIGAAWVNKPLNESPYSLHRYSFRAYSIDMTKIYYQYDLTSAGYVEGVDYDCDNAAYVCTFMADPFQSHVDFFGSYFFVSQIPESGINKSGFFVLD